MEYTKEDLIKDKNIKCLIWNRTLSMILANKTKTRRVLKLKNKESEYIGREGPKNDIAVFKVHSEDNTKPQYEKVKLKLVEDDIFWNRESAKVNTYCYPFEDGELDYIEYSYASNPKDDYRIPIKEKYQNLEDIPVWVTSFHYIPNGCTREMARYFDKVTSVEIEYLQDISDEDIKKEGIDRFREMCSIPEEKLTDRELFAILWDTTATKGVDDWNSNPRVAAIEYKRLELISMSIGEYYTTITQDKILYNELKYANLSKLSIIKIVNKTYEYRNKSTNMLLKVLEDIGESVTTDEIDIVMKWIKTHAKI